jgi:peptidoglycan hydrolase-like protein with peptidoglycan-binding domain
MSDPVQPTIALGATGAAVRRLQLALRRTPDLGLMVDGIFGPQVGTAVKNFLQRAGLAVSGTVDALTWNALPDGGPMPTLEQGSCGDVVRALQSLLTNGALGQWTITALGIDGALSPHTRSSVEAFQAWPA